jgi:hypothetical protein
MDFTVIARREYSMQFLHFYMILMERNIKNLRENCEKIFLGEFEFRQNIWHNFALNFRDPTFSQLVSHEKSPTWYKLLRIVNYINLFLENIYEKSK